MGKTVKTPRNSDGTLRRADRPRQLTNRSIVARWVEAETLHLKRLGMAFQTIADHIVEVAQGRQKAMVPISDGVVFSEDYRISTQAVHRAFRRAIVRLPNAEAFELRKLDSERLDEMLLSLQPGIRRGDPRSVEVGVKVLVHKAELNGYKAPARVEMTGTQLNVLVERQAADAQVVADLDRLTIEELREYRRLEAKARGIPEVIEIEAVQMTTSSSEDAEPAESDETEENHSARSD
jgi:hypothetical protein